MTSPTSIHWATVKRILRYLHDTIDMGLCLTKSCTDLLTAFSDADGQGILMIVKALKANAIIFGGNLISWSSRKQSTVSRSSAKTEYKAVADATTELIWIQVLLRELGISQARTPSLWCDNIGATYLSSNPIFHRLMKHVDVDYHFVRERVSTRQLDVRLISSKDSMQHPAP